MMRVTTLYAGSAAATARYYTRYLTEAPGELPGEWLGAAGGRARADAARCRPRRWSCCCPVATRSSGSTLGYPLRDRTLADGRVVRAVAGFDATLSAPKSLSVWWALTGDAGLAECHDVAVRAVVDYLERFGSTTRVRSNGGRLHPDTQGLTVAAFRQTTSRLDDPQLHTHLVISAKVQTVDGRWLALDARVLKRHQRALGGSVSVGAARRAHPPLRGRVRRDRQRSGRDRRRPDRAAASSSRNAPPRSTTRSAVKVAEFRQREGRDPTRFERAALGTRGGRGHPAAQDRPRCPRSARHGGAAKPPASVSPPSRSTAVDHRGRPRRGRRRRRVTVGEVIEELSAPPLGVASHGRAAGDHATGSARSPACPVTVGGSCSTGRSIGCSTQCVDLDPAAATRPRRASDGRSVWIEPVAAHVTSDQRPRPGGSDPHLGDRRPTRRPATVDDDRPGRARRAPSRRRRGGRR